MKIAEYNDMMSYLTRQNFSSGTNKPRTVSDLIKSKDIVTGDKYEPKKPKLIQSIRAFEEKYGFRKKESDGGPQIIPPSKPAEDPLEVFKKQADLFLQGSFGSSNKTFFNNLIEQEYNKALDAGVLPEEAISFLKERSEMYRKLAEEGRMQGEPAILGPSYGREDKAIGGGAFVGEELPNNREGFASTNYKKKLVTQRFLNQSQTKFEDLTPKQQELFNKGELYVVRIKAEKLGKDRFRLKNVFGSSDEIDILRGDLIPEDLTNLPDEMSTRSVAATNIRKKFIKDYLATLPEGKVINLDATVREISENLKKATNNKISLNAKDLLMDALEDKESNPNNVRGPKDLKESKQIQYAEKGGYDASKEEILEKAEELNEKYNLEDKGIRFKEKKIKGTNIDGDKRHLLKLEFTGAPFKKYKDKAVPLTEEGIAELEKILKPVVETEDFKTYSAIQAKKEASEKSGRKRVAYNQPELMKYLLEQGDSISKEQVIKDFEKFDYNEGILKKAIGNLHANLYRALDPSPKRNQRALFIQENYTKDEIKNVLDKVKNNFPGNYYKRTFEKLLIDAYGDFPETYKPLAEKLSKFRELQTELRKAGVEKELLAELDHVIPYNFLQLVREGKDPGELLRVKAYPGVLNQATFKGAIDVALGKAAVL